MIDKISEAIGLIQQAIDENTRTARGTSCGCDVDLQVCDVCKKACDEDLGGHEEGCFVGWLQEALRILDDTAPQEGTRQCTCHPDDNPPIPCAKKYALDECRKAAQEDAKDAALKVAREALEMAWSREYVSGIEARRLGEEALAAINAAMKESKK